MADRPLNPAFQRAPLQESRTHNINQPREYHRINALNIHSGLYNKPGQDVGIARSTTSVKMPLKPNMPAPQSDKDNTRTRIALQQKPLNGNNSSNVRAPLGSSRTLPNSVYKLKPVPFPGFTSTTPSYTRSDATLEKPNPDRPQAQPHQPDQVQHPPQPWDTQSQSQPQLSGPEWGSREWKQKMEEKLARCCFFFDSVDPAVANKITSVARKYGGRRTQFFSKDATHVITTRPVPGGSVLKRIRNKGDSGQSLAIQQDPKRMTTKPLAPPLAPNAETNILVKALELGMKIWTLDEALKLLSHVDPRLGKRNDNHKLEDMLQYEKVHGVATAHIDNSTKPDFHVFQGKYVLVDDATGFYRTIMAYDFTATPSETGKQPWPKIYIQDTDRSPFCYIEPAVKESERPPEARDDKGEDAKADKDCGDAPQEAQPMENEKISPSAMASGIVNSVTSNIVSTSTSAATKPLAATNLQQDRRVEQLEKRALNATKAETGISVDSFKRPEFAHPLDIVRPDTTNTASGHAARNVDPDRETTKDARHTMQPPNQPLKQEPGHTMPTNNDHLVAQLDTLDPERNKATDAAPALPAPADMHIGVGLNPSHKEAKDYRKKGYCENCRGFFDNFEKHVESAAHQKYANNAAKFAQLDVLLAKLQRRPRVASALSEPPRSATTIPESESSDSPSVTAPCSDKPATLAPEPADKEYIQDAVDLALQDHQNPGLPLGMPVDATQPAQDQAQSQGEPMWEAQDAQEAHEDREAHEDQEPFDGALSQTRRDDEEDEGIVEDMDDEAPVEDFEDQGALTLQSTGGVADPDDLADQLSSELSQMGLAERGVDVHCDQSVEPVTIQKQEETPVESLEAVKAPTTSSLQKVLRHEFRLPASDRGGPSEGNLTSQITTDTTQPDDRFLGCSGTDSADSGFATPIRLHFDLESTAESPSVPRDLGRPHFSPGGLHESDIEGSDDSVAMIKSPSAGRGAFASAQGARLRSGGFTTHGLGGDSSPTRDITSGLYKGALKRKLENVLAEERAVNHHQSRMGMAVETPDTPRPGTLFAHRQPLQERPQRLPQSSQPPSTPLRPTSWIIHSPAHTSTLPPLLSSSPLSSPLPQNGSLESLFQTTPPPATSSVQANLSAQQDPYSLQRQAQLSSGYFHHSLNSQLEYEASTSMNRGSRHHSQKNSVAQHTAPDPLSHQQSSPMSARRGTPIVPFENYQPGAQHPQTMSAVGNARVYEQVQQQPATPTSPTSPFAYAQPGGSQSPMDSVNFSSHGFLSPTRSPSRRAAQRTQFPVMSHAEQEEERCYHHYHGNQLPEPAGQKKLRSSSSLTEAYEEYGEGCMVFIE